MLDDIGWDVAIDGQGRVVVAGLLGVTPAEGEAVVAVLDPVMGQEIWRRTLPDAVYNIEQMAGWLAIAGGDDVILGTRTWAAETGFDLVLHRFAASDGSEVWHRRWNSGGTTADDPRAMAVDPATGDVVMAGVTGGDYLVARFAAGDGAPLWQGTYAGPPDWYDVATCVTVAADGTVLASGFSDGSGTGWDVATVAFAGDTGSQRWAVRFDGHGQSDEARDIASAPDGRVYVTGYAFSYESNNDLLSLCYATDGGATAAPADVPAAAAVTAAWPNPFNPQVTVAYALARGGPARLSVHDLRGRLVADLASGVHAAGPHTATWNGVDHAGRTVPSGVYLAVLRADGVQASWKLVLGK
jgi:hypothetical protein